MYPNLKAEMIRYGIKAKDIAALLGVTPAMVYSKMSCRTKVGFSLDKAIKIRDTYFPAIRLEDLFANKTNHAI
jgi:hypothetical protein